MSQILNTLAEIISGSKAVLVGSPKAEKMQSVDYSPVNQAMASFDLSRELLESACLDSHKLLRADKSDDRSKSLDFKALPNSRASSVNKDCDLSSLNESLIKLDPLQMTASHEDPSKKSINYLTEVDPQLDETLKVGLTGTGGKHNALRL